MFKFLSQTLVEIATETDKTEKRFISQWRQHFDKNRYFRFSVDQGLQHIKLTEYQEQGAIEAATDGYLDHQAQGFRVRDCVRNLKLKQNMLETTHTDRSELKYRCDMWLRPSNMREIYNDQIQEKLHDTCDWIWSHPVFLEWSNTSTYPAAADSRLLCIYGTHGCGKSVLASLIVESLKRKGNQVLFFSFSGSDINITISMPGLIYWVIDGVDKCKESGEELFNQVIDLLTANKDARAVLLGRTHILQPIKQINYAIEITPSLIEPDINAFISTEIERSNLLNSSEIRDLALKTLRDRSQGMFLWVKLMVGDLRKSSSKAETIQRLHNLPHGLQRAYRHLLLQLVEDLDTIDLRFTRRLLAFVIAARRPLKIEELQYAEALASRSDLKNSHECSLEDCMSEDLAAKVSGVVLLVHISAKEFLTRPESEWSCDGDHKIVDLRIDPEESHNSFVSTCIEYLGIGKYGFPLQDQDESSILYDVHPFLEYSTKNLIYHINRAGRFSVDAANKFHQDLGLEESLSWVEYFAIHLVEDGSSGVEAEEFTTWLGNGAKGELWGRIKLHLSRHLENPRQSSDGSDRRIYLYRMVLDMIAVPVDDESIDRVSDRHPYTPSFTMHKCPNDIQRTVPIMMEIFNQNSALPAPKQLDMLALTDPLELLFRLILRNARNAPVYALMMIGGFYERVNQPEKALHVYHSAVAKFENCEVPMKYRILNAIGSVTYDLGRYWEAEETYRRAVEGLGRLLGESHPDTVSGMYRLGCTFEDQNKHAEAEEAFQKVIKEEKRIYGPEHADTLISIHRLGCTLYNQNKYSKAQETFQQAVKGRQKILGLDHRDTLDSMRRLGHTFKDQGNMYELGWALDIFQRTMEGKRKALGSEHSDVFDATNEAEEMYRQATRGFEKIYGLEHASTLVALYNLAEAEKMFRRVLGGREKTIHMLGTAFEYQDKYAQAKEMYQRAIKGRGKTLGPGHEDTLHSVDCLGDMRALFD
ncbi:TPR-like protein [Daldinia grandis]|nr:TPR-like protein [Daldinia grandis]